MRRTVIRLAALVALIGGLVLAAAGIAAADAAPVPTDSLSDRPGMVGVHGPHLNLLEDQLSSGVEGY